MWLPKRSAYLRRIIAAEGVEVNTCIHCDKVARWRCQCCLGRPMFCRECCRNSHRQHIYHRIQKWTGRFFQDASLWEVGVRLNVGHVGQECPSQSCLLEACRFVEERKDAEDHLSATQYNFGPVPNHDQQPDSEEPPAAPDSFPILDEPDPDDSPWEDIPSTSGFGSVPLRTTVPAVDDLDIPHLLIVDASGLFSLPAIYCSCDNSGEPDHLLLDLGLFASSYINIKTVFTFGCLDDYRLSNLDCKTTAYQYYQKLRRSTNPAFPHAVPNRYNEFRRATRQWRNLKLRKWFGFGHRLIQPSKGSMALFCAACPQPGVNLPTDHPTRYTE